MKHFKSFNSYIYKKNILIYMYIYILINSPAKIACIQCKDKTHKNTKTKNKKHWNVHTFLDRKHFNLSITNKSLNKK